MHDSLWNTSLPQFSPVSGDRKTQVLVIGGGLAGLLTAFELKNAGVDCLLIEADHICSGVTRNTTAKITSQHGLIYQKLLREFGHETAFLYWKANEEALARYRQLCGDIACEFEEKDAYVYAKASEPLENELSALQRLGIHAEFVSDLPLPIKTAGAVRLAGQAQFHPLKFAAAIAKDLNICEHTRAISYDGKRIVTNHGNISADKIVAATHYPLFNKHGGYFLKLYQERAYVLALEKGPDVGGMYASAEPEGFSFRNHGEFLLLGGSAHRTGKPGRGWNDLRHLAERCYPKSRPAYYWATQDCMSLDGVPYIGRYSRRTPNLFVAAGFNKWGMTSSMAAAMLLKDLLLDRESPYEKVFSPSRTILRPQLLANARETTANLLTFSKPRCPHLGCALKWNRQERSWDCPCHGSRFAEDGTLLDNPASGNLFEK